MPYNPPAVSPRGGPQPAKKKSPPAKKMPPPSSLPSGGRRTAPSMRPSAAAVQTGAAVSRALGSIFGGGGQWAKPTADELMEFLNTYVPTEAGSRATSLPIVGPAIDPVRAAHFALTSPAAGLIGDAAAVNGLLATADSPADLANKLGIPEADLEGLLNLPAQRKVQNEALDIDQMVARAQAEAAVNDQFAPPARGGSTPDSIDRMADPRDLTTPQPYSSQELVELYAAMQDQALGDDGRFGEAKKAIWNETAAAIARTEEINAAYRAGLEGGGGPVAPMAPGESTAQDQYGVAGAVTPSVAPYTPTFGELDTYDAEQKILDTAADIEAARVEQADKALATKFADLVDARAADEKLVADEALAAEEAKRKAAEKETKREAEAVAKRRYADDYVTTTVAEVAEAGLAPSNPGMTGRSDRAITTYDERTVNALINRLTSLISSGATRSEAIQTVFGDRELLGIPLDEAELRMVTAAQVAAGRIPDTLKDDYQTWVDGAYAEYGVG